MRERFVRQNKLRVGRNGFGEGVGGGGRLGGVLNFSQLIPGFGELRVELNGLLEVLLRAVGLFIQPFAARFVEGFHSVFGSGGRGGADRGTARTFFARESDGADVGIVQDIAIGDGERGGIETWESGFDAAAHERGGEFGLRIDAAWNIGRGGVRDTGGGGIDRSDDEVALGIGAGGVTGLAAAGDGDEDGVPRKSATRDGDAAEQVISGAALARKRVPVGELADVAAGLRTKRGTGGRRCGAGGRATGFGLRPGRSG